MINMPREDIEKFGISLQADLSEEAFNRIKTDIDSAAEALTIFEGTAQNFMDVVMAAVAEKRAAKAEEEARKLQGITEEEEEEEQADS